MSDRVRYTVIFDLPAAPIDDPIAAADDFHRFLVDITRHHLPSMKLAVVARRAISENELPVSELGHDIPENIHNFPEDPT